VRVVGYVRVSSERQAEEGVSLAAQRARIEAWCAANGGQLAPADLFVDAGISGKRADNRPGLVAALGSVTARPGAALVLYRLSRLARSTRDTINMAERLEKAGADLVSLSEKIDTTSASGKMVFRLLAVLAEFERDLISERTKTALAHLRRRGQRTGQVPLGKSLAADGVTLEPDAAELAVVAEVRAWHAAGWTLRAIARELTARGVPTKNGRPAWNHMSVAKIVRRPDPLEEPR
jgi:site-specific DNA recombinase